MSLSAEKQFLRRFTAPFACVLAFLLLFSPILTLALNAETGGAEEMLSDIIKFASGNTDGGLDGWIDGSLADEPQMNEWYAIGISRLKPDADLTAYAEALEKYLSENTVYSATTKQKYGLALIACGKKDSEYLSGLVDGTAGKQGIMSYVFALHLLTNGAPSELYTPENLIPVLLALACEGGGWSLTGKSPDVDVTAMTVQALAPYYGAYDEVKNAVDAAILRLSAMQAEDGGFSSYGEANPESAAQVVIALVSVGRDPLNDADFIKGGRTPLDAVRDYRLEDGSYSHRAGGGYNHAATAQAFLAFTAILCRDGGAESEPFFLFGEAPSDFPALDNSVVDTLPDRNGESGAGGGDQVGGDGSEGEGSDEVGSGKKTGAYKLPVCIGIGVVAATVCTVMLLRKRRAVSDYVIVLGVAAALCLGVVFINVYTPDEYYGQPVSKEEPIGTVTVEIVCDTALTGRKDAVILGKTAAEIEAGETVYDLLAQLCRANGIVLDAMAGSPTGGVYVRGIDGLHEFAHGDTSGWTYTVNGQQVNIGSDKYVLKDGDTVVWLYSDTLGSFSLP